MIGMKEWKTMIVSKLMYIYGCGALAWYQRECDDLEVIQNGFERWLCKLGNVRNELVRGESGWSSFAEREVKCILDWLFMIVYEESMVTDIGRDRGYRDINKDGMAMLGIKFDRNLWKKTFVVRIQEYGRRPWRNGFGINEREQQYVYMKSQTQNEKYANGSVESRVRLMFRGGCLPVRGSKGMECKYDDDLCVCGTKETARDPCVCF